MSTECWSSGSLFWWPLIPGKKNTAGETEPCNAKISMKSGVASYTHDDMYRCHYNACGWYLEVPPSVILCMRSIRLWRCPPLPIQTRITTSLPFLPILVFLLTAPCRSYPFLPLYSDSRHPYPLTACSLLPSSHLPSLLSSYSLSPCHYLSLLVPYTFFTLPHLSLFPIHPFPIIPFVLLASFPPISLSPFIHLLPSLLFLALLPPSTIPLCILPSHSFRLTLTLSVAVTRILSLPFFLSSSIPHTTPLLPSHSFPLLYSLPPLHALPPLYTRIYSAFPAFPLFSPPPPSSPLLSLHSSPPPLRFALNYISCISCIPHIRSIPSPSPLISPIATVGNAHALAAFVSAIPNTQTFVRFDDDGGDEKVLRPWDVYSPLGARLAFCVQTLTNVVARMKLRSDDAPGIAVDTVSRGAELWGWAPSVEATFN